MTGIYKALVEIVGEKHVSNLKEELYFYGRDGGIMPAHEPEYLVAPETTEEVQKIVRLANREKIPITPMGAGMSMAGLSTPLRGGIVVDMKRMRKILEVNEKARYAVVEGGTSMGVLKAFLEKNYPHLAYSMPEAPPSTTLASNMAIHGQGNLAMQYGFNSDMVGGLEVVLPTGEICKTGSYSMSPYFFSKGPSLPDISGLFLGWLGATGIITKVGVKLYPRKKIRDLDIFATDRIDLVQEIVLKVSHTGLTESINISHSEEIYMFKGNYLIIIYFTGDTDEEIDFKRKMIWDSVKEYRLSKDGGFMNILPSMKPAFVEIPRKFLTMNADMKKGGGFEYCGPIILLEKYPVLVQKVIEVGDKYNVTWLTGVRVMDCAHSMMFAISFPYNRADYDMIDRIRKALHEWTVFAFDQGGIPWKPTVEEQKLAMERMDPNALKLMKMIKENLDPNGIMKPGNWEVS